MLVWVESVKGVASVMDVKQKTVVNVYTALTCSNLGAWKAKEML